MSMTGAVNSDTNPDRHGHYFERFIEIPSKEGLGPTLVHEHSPKGQEYLEQLCDEEKPPPLYVKSSDALARLLRENHHKEYMQHAGTVTSELLYRACFERPTTPSDERVEDVQTADPSDVEKRRLTKQINGLRAQLEFEKVDWKSFYEQHQGDAAAAAAIKTPEPLQPAQPPEAPQTAINSDQNGVNDRGSRSRSSSKLLEMSDERVEELRTGNRIEPPVVSEEMAVNVVMGNTNEGQSNESDCNDKRPKRKRENTSLWLVVTHESAAGATLPTTTTTSCHSGAAAPVWLRSGFWWMDWEDMRAAEAETLAGVAAAALTLGESDVELSEDDEEDGGVSLTVRQSLLNG
ncbi:hypothetical protein IQ07DRAFT_646168 [Pyrenochaeta sp. DS3sAY3a]|nr:hypothetical protein IQ07DRAFT_646168 [Pyrenochaeta sp. DS3sAY3a]